jgi:hypothetical protein
MSTTNLEINELVKGVNSFISKFVVLDTKFVVLATKFTVLATKFTVFQSHAPFPSLTKVPILAKGAGVAKGV